VNSVTIDPDRHASSAIPAANRGINPMKTYQAPWSRLLIIMSTFSTVLVVAVTSVTIWVSEGPHRWAGFCLLAILAVAAMFVVRGYTIANHGLSIHRWLWTTELPLPGLREALADPDAMRGSIRIFGNGGMYSFTGLFRKKKLGVFRAYVTDPTRAVVLKFAGRTVVVSPDTPDAFAREIMAMHGTRDA
jgi:hypothetical protein